MNSQSQTRVQTAPVPAEDRPSLLDHVRALEGENRQGRRRELLRILSDLGIHPDIQQGKMTGITNIVVDFALPARAKILFSAHYDAVKGSPGANDNASGVAVLLGLCRELKCSRVPARVVFFDREEAWLHTPFLKLGLLGSLRYAFTTDLRGLRGVYNLEFCGNGDTLVIWSVKEGDRELPVVKTAVRVAGDLGLLHECVHIPWLFIGSDHLPFRIKGLADAVTLSLIPRSQVPILRCQITGLSVRRLLSGQRPQLAEPLASIHSLKDNSGNINEESLRRMLRVVEGIARGEKRQ